MSAYYYNEDNFNQHNIISNFLEKGMDYILTDKKFRKTLKLQDDMNDIDFLDYIYYNLGFTTVYKDPSGEHPSIDYIKQLSTKYMVTKSEKEIASKACADINLTVPNISRDMQAKIDEVANYIYVYAKTYRDRKIFKADLLSTEGKEYTEYYHLDDIVNMGAEKFFEFQLFKVKAKKSKKKTDKVKESKTNTAPYRLSNEECTNLLAVHTRDNICTFFLGSELDNNVELIERKIKEKILYLYNGKGYYNSSHYYAYCVIDSMIKRSGNIINGCKAAISACKELQGLKEDSEKYKEILAIYYDWIYLVCYWRQTARVSIYDFISDIYFQGEIITTPKRIIYGNLSDNNILSVSLASGTFVTDTNLIQKILKMKSLEITPDNKLFSGKTDIWSKLFGVSKPRDGNYLNITNNNKL